MTSGLASKERLMLLCMRAVKLVGDQRCTASNSPAKPPTTSTETNRRQPLTGLLLTQPCRAFPAQWSLLNKSRASRACSVTPLTLETDVSRSTMDCFNQLTVAPPHTHGIERSLAKFLQSADRNNFPQQASLSTLISRFFPVISVRHAVTAEKLRNNTSPLIMIPHLP